MIRQVKKFKELLAKEDLTEKDLINSVYMYAELTAQLDVMRKHINEAINGLTDKQIEFIKKEFSPKAEY